VHQEPAPAPPATLGFRIRRPFPVATAGSHPQATQVRPGTERVLARTQDSLIGEFFAPEVLTPTGMRLREMDPLSHRRANRVRTARDPLEGCMFHERPSASVHPDAPPQRRQAPPPPEDAQGAAKASPLGRTRARPHQPTPGSARH